MTTAAQVKKMVQPLLARHSDLALVGRWIYLKPVHHVARAVLIDRMLNPEKFRPQWAVVHLFQARKSFPLNWGEWLCNESSPTPGSWKITDANTSQALIDQIERHALPKLRMVKTLDDYLAFVSQHIFRHKLFDWPHCKIIVDAALGDLEAARAIGEKNSQRWSNWSDNPDLDEDGKAKFHRVSQLCAKLAEDDRAGLARLLHEWEAHTVKNFKIEHLWEQTPFPLELAG